MCEALRDTGMWNVYTQIELPLIFTLDSMEKWGISVKSEELKSYGEKLSVRIGELEKQIWQQAGEPQAQDGVCGPPPHQEGKAL